MKTILCPTDFSKNALNAAAYACALAEKFQATVVLLHAYERPVDFTESQFVLSPDTDDMLKTAASKNLSVFVQKITRQYPKVKIDPMLVAGAGHTEIVAAAAANDADLIIMGATGTSKIERLLMGSTASRVIHQAPCPVLCIPKEAAFNGINKIVFATDLKDDNISSARNLVPFATAFSAEIVFVFVDDKHLLHADSEISKMTQKIRKQVKYPKISGYISKNTSITKGLEYFLKKYPADILAMFTHQRHFPESLFNQSITKLMSHQVRIPLLAMQQTDRPLL
jgi:nucleotide-binding universal stress UspA family protein